MIETVFRSNVGYYAFADVIITIFVNVLIV